MIPTAPVDDIAEISAKGGCRAAGGLNILEMSLTVRGATWTSAREPPAITVNPGPTHAVACGPGADYMAGFMNGRSQSLIDGHGRK